MKGIVSRWLLSCFICLFWAFTVISCKNQDTKTASNNSTQQSNKTAEVEKLRAGLYFDSAAGKFFLENSMWLQSISAQSKLSHFLPSVFPKDDIADVDYDYVEVSLGVIKEFFKENKTLKFHACYKPDHKYFRLSMSVVDSGEKKYIAQAREYNEANDAATVKDYKDYEKDSDLYLFKSQIRVVQEAIKNFGLKDYDYVVFNPISFQYNNAGHIDTYNTYTISYWQAKAVDGYQQIPAGLALNPSPPFKTALQLYLK